MAKDQPKKTVVVVINNTKTNTQTRSVEQVLINGRLDVDPNDTNPPVKLSN